MAEPEELENKRPKLKLAVKTNAAEVPVSTDLRNAAGLNSPTANDTPNTALRNNAAINSPHAEANLADFMTQVDRPDPNQKKQENSSESTQTREETKPKSSSGGWCSCFGAAKVEPSEIKPKEIEATPPKKATSNKAPEVGELSADYTDEDYERENKGILGPREKSLRKRKTIVLDLDETLVHSSFKAVPNADFQVPVDIDGTIHTVYVLKRPYADEFLEMCGEHYEVVLFTASLSKYANPLLDQLDTKRVIHHRLFRESCVQIGYSYIKDLSQLGRKMSEILIVDNSPHSYRFQPNNAVPCTSWFDDKKDTELKDIIPCLETTIKHIDDVRKVLDAQKSYQWLCQQAEKE